ncbi:MAG: 1-(5-phosphoribosyl)-5-[(5-phosphoribosylamino)methylideneamino]imidazole-4-carboxamide isomerase [SAR116 cluster bacterium MED-G06]|nr:MAG: 1-(5-phosphoribosyl)-5-[(5-phosphoribosylamino)methylideneamino]imidazole-4-carboxamide isomerase [SAR116 cluster bacterium MED-G06]
MIYPAIDLIAGEVVRLHKGDFAQKTTYGTDPVAVARAYADAGASWLHLVDLDGAKDPAHRQTTLISRIIEGSGLKVQTGGGIRSRADVEALLSAGASRVVIGSLAVRDQDTVAAMIADLGVEAICLAADVVRPDQDFMIAVSGWQEASTMTLADFIEGFLPSGLRHVLCTDIDRDGTLTGPNKALYDIVKAAYPDIRLQASGGVKGIEDLDGLGTDGVIIGRAIYEQKIDLKAALELGGPQC